MIIATVVFGDPIFHRMADVLEYSVSQNCPGAEFLRMNVEPHVHISGIPDHCPANAHKKKFWAEVVYSYPGETIALLDCDTLVLQSLSDVFDREFDLAYTTRNYRVPLNAGVMFVRSTKATMRFFDKWNQFQQTLLSEEERPHLHARLRKYAGLDQAAFSQMLHNVDWPFHAIELPCEIYNSVDQTWHLLTPETKILHVKGRLRRFAAIDDEPAEKHPALAKAITIWRDYESRAATTQIGA